MNLFGNQNEHIAIPAFALNLALAAAFGFLLGLVYARFGRSLSNRRVFGRHFLPLALTTALVISIVKSSLALSLGLVGALSIVRFRAAIKEPEELVYLFLAIGVGLGLGAGQTAATSLAFALILIVILLQSLLRGRSDRPNLHLTVTSSASAPIGAARLQNLLAQCGVTAHITGLDEASESIEVAFRLAPVDTSRLEEFNRKLLELDPGARARYVAERAFGD